MKTIMKFRFLQPLAYDLGHKALDQVKRQFGYVIDALKKRKRQARGWKMSPCTGCFTKQWGLPCKHLMWERLHQGVQPYR